METVNVIIQVATTLWGIEQESVFHTFVIILFILGLFIVAMVPYAIISLLETFRCFILGVAYRLSPGMQKDDAEVEKLEAVQPSVFGNLFTKRPLSSPSKKIAPKTTPGNTDKKDCP